MQPDAFRGLGFSLLARLFFTPRQDLLAQAHPAGVTVFSF